ncbi:MAG: hypothetical protein Q9180_002917 [Flavoplaca navasiana]
MAVSMLRSVFSSKKRRFSQSGEIEEVEGQYLDIDDELGLELLYKGNDPVVDIVAVHGLDGHREKTWTAENGVFWLKSLLPSDISQARIYTYGYDARTHSGEDISKETFYGNAQTLLGELTLERRFTETQRRPIIFVAHSLGGLLVKKALVLSNLANETHLPDQKDIQMSTFAILFFGTPHQGSDMTAWGNLLVKLCGVYYQTNDRWLSHLESKSESIESGLGEFASVASRITIIYFYETLPTPTWAGGSAMVGPIVDKSSAVPPSTNTEAVDTRRHHLNMVKFASKTEYLYKTVIRHLSLLLKDASCTIEQPFKELRAIRASPDIRLERPAQKLTGPPASHNSQQPTVQTVRSHKRARKTPIIGSFSTRNEKFVGRKEELEIIDKCLNPQLRSQGQKSCAVYGLGGIGKTQILREYLWSFRSHYSLAIWLRASDVALLAQDLSQIATEVCKSTEGAPEGARNQSKDIEIAHQDWLLVFDNLDSINVLRQYLPICDHGSILITTQDLEIAATASVELALESLDDEEGARLLLSYLKHNDQGAVPELAAQISHELGGLPLAIVHVAGYIRQTHAPLERFLKDYRSAYSQEIDNNYTSLYATQYEKTYATVWSLALKGLEKDARDFIDTVAFFSADKVPEEIFLAHPVHSPSESHISAGSAANPREPNRNLDKMIRQFSKTSLIERDHSEPTGSTLSIHRQLQRSLILELVLDPARSKRIFDYAVTLLRRVFPPQNLVIEQMTKHWPECKQYMDQVLSFHKVYSALPDPFNTLGPNLTFARILCDCGQYLWEQSMNQSAERVLQLANDVCDKGATPGKPLALRASILFRQCSVEIDAGYSGIKRAIPKFREAISVQQKVLKEMQRDGEDITAEYEIPLANGLNNLGCCYLHLSQYEEAEPLFQESLEIKKQEKWGKTESMAYEFAESSKNIAIVRAAQGDLDEALRLSQESVELVGACMGPESSRTYFFLFMRACIMIDSGATEAALSLHLTILHARKKLLGEAHNYTASSYYMVGYTYHRLCDLPKAR